MRYSRAPRPVTRVVALFLATLLSFTITSDAFGFDPCPHHGVPARTAHDAMSHHQMPSQPHSQHHSDSTRQHHDTQTQHHDTQHGVCTCLGACSAAAAIPVPSAPEIQAVVTQAPAHRSQFPTAEAPASSHSLELLPYGIAPPAPTEIR